MTVYLIGLVICIPVGVYYWHKNSSIYGEGNIHNETYKFFASFISQAPNAANMTIKDFPEILATAGEYNHLSNGKLTEDAKNHIEKVNNRMLKEGVMNKVNVPYKAALVDKKAAAVIQFNTLIHYWLQRQPLEPAELFSEVTMNEILSKSMRLMEVILELVARNRFLFSSIAGIDFMQLLTQKAWQRESPFLQLPHFSVAETKHVKGTLRQYIDMKPEDRKGMAKFTAEQKADVETVLKMLPRIDVNCKAYTEEDEEFIYGGDLVTIEVAFKRANLEEGEEATHVYAPHFPVVKAESWWVICNVIGETGMIAAPSGIKKITSLTREVVVSDIKVVAPKAPGKYNYMIYVKSSDYIGLDVECKVEINVRPDTEAPKFVAHPDDLALDKEPTLFQQVYGKQIEEESDSSDDEGETKGEDHGHSHAKQHGHSHNGVPWYFMFCHKLYIYMTVIYLWQ